MAGLFRKTVVAVVLAALAAFCFATESHAQSLGVGRLLSPGDLAKSHAELDSIKRCVDCHDLKGGVNNEKCLDCHKEIKVIIDPSKGATGGYHSHSSVRDKKCQECHHDHKGRSFYMIQWEKGKREFFNHDLTGYALSEKHKIAECEKCHTKKTKQGHTTYLGLTRDCISCHKDVHLKTLGEKCEKCHVNYHSFKGMDVRLDHDQQTKFQLDGKHMRVSCDKCHAKRTKDEATFKITGHDRCVTCHKKDDTHKNALGDKCESCHTAADWKKVKFNHEKARFALKGKHLDIKCESCHPAGAKGSFKVEKFENCSVAGCHDVPARGLIHGKQFEGRKCEDCHSEAGWKSLLFKHDNASYKGFKLKGKHAKVECSACHRATAETVAYKGGHARVLYKPIDSAKCDSKGCHDIAARGKIHGEQFAGRACDECHNESGWKPSLFKHESASYKGFKLEGEHAEVKCGECHYKNNAGVQIFKPIDYKRCDNAHCHDMPARGAIHGKQFEGTSCDNCHSMKDWKPTTFSHSAASYRGFKLDGKHSEVKCQKCHKTDEKGGFTYEGKKRPLVTYRGITHDTCGATGCHTDPHKKVFEPKRCEVCHVAADWKNMTAKFSHTLATHFPLTGKHKTVKCGDCHKNNVWKPVSMDCVSCHKKDDKHKGKLGTACDECHTTANWSPKAVAHERTGFPLTETHAQLVCSDCHTKGKGNYSGLGPDCQQCHSDPHLNQMGRLCGDCHTMRSWEPSKFKHSLTGFRLEGVHRYLPCSQCHQGRVYRAIPSDCISCHGSAFARPSAYTFHYVYNPTFDTNCVRCHTQYTWTVPRP